MKGKGISTMWIVLISVAFLASAIGAGIGMWGKHYVNEQQKIADAELQARKDVAEVNSQMGDNKTFTVSTTGKEYRIIRFTASGDQEVFEQLTESVLKDKELLRILKKVGFREIQISTTEQDVIVYVDLINNTIGKKSNI